MSGFSVRAGQGLALILVGAALVGCSSKALNRAPVEDRNPDVIRPVPIVVTSSPTTTQALAGQENMGKVGYYVVKPGDTLIRIGLDQGQSARDIARWNNIENLNRIEVGQVLRVLPPGASPGGASAEVVAKPVILASAAPTVVPLTATSNPEKRVSAPPMAAGSAPVPTAAAAGSDEEISWIWPTKGVVLAGFDEVKNKGLDIGGALGDQVLAAADGRVVYVGAGLRGYGNLIILKHNNTYLSAYAHNHTLLVKEDQSVRKGQKIAEMGSSDVDRVKLHFEVRRQGKPVDPLKYLPVR